MSEFAGVTVTKKANVYFDGNVTSRVITFADGTVKTLGIMLPGEYEFGTDKPEVMEIMAGELTVKLPGSDEWVAIKGGESFDVPGSAKFQLKVTAVTDYCCSYVD
ncbi:pyrimidine/purine nucleoside phosphorylase [Pseudodesulfovibrio sp. zrk46]|uniref:pyrimidine/purine nucleoside phosphorylase n=1 Tax=Pseudodesulfovibrio sp. zrk46 TaxID=2725288 RepID=UPI00144920CE|nr:pyrimidine/purine nucleoside phosphorylase [Pseudodesulfovibrio sp. zrk46]QJB55354.1 pyrimidine/purine nucleoside phosphorylase [Pseudodesulfovibrio sp. zrk46]